MGTSRLLTKAQSRPRKSETEKRKRLRTQKQRLIAAGMDEAALRSMNAAEIRAALRRAARVSVASISMS